jgi:hypothetical protein
MSSRGTRIGAFQFGRHAGPVGYASLSRARVACLALSILGIAAAAPATAVAWNEDPKAPEYSLSIVEGVTTQPEESILSTSGSVRPRAETVLTIIHGGAVVAKDTESNGDVWLSQVPQVGDVVTLETPVGHAVGSVVYDGLPSMDPTVCAGSTNFSGQRSPGMEVSGGVFTLVSHPRYTARHPGESAQVTTLSGQSFAGNFLTPLAGGQTVEAAEQLQTPLAGGATFTYTSKNERPVGACPVPPAPPPPPPPPALLGSILKLRHITIARLLHSGWTDQVTINQPGTVIQDLYLQGGHVPASASSAGKGGHRRAHKRPAVLLARGSASTAAAGTVTVKLKPTSQGRRRLKHARSVRAVLVTTLRSASGQILSLGHRSVSLHR